MINIKNKKECCGCGACANTCPVKCIEMIPDEKGFLYPRIDADKCVNCGKCEKSCPIINHSQKVIRDEVKGYVAYNNNTEERMNSSSGGIFSALARKILEQDGIVYGVEYDENFLVHHVQVKSEDELQRIRGSKYIQSRTENVYSEIKKLLEEDKKILFSGTACQVAGLKQFLNKDFDTLYTVDVLCHGVPSTEVWKRYISELEEKKQSRIKSINQRNKSNGWFNYLIHIDFENEKQYEMDHAKDPFMKLFLSNICLRESCHACRFKKLERHSDITIGDAWGVNRYAPEMNDNKGVSIVFARGDKGRYLVSAISNQLNFIEGDPDIILSPTDDARVSVNKHKKSDLFWKEFQDGKCIDSLVRIVKDSIFKRVYWKVRNILELRK